MFAAIFAGPGEVELRQQKLSVLKPGFVTIKSTVCGVCGSDLHVYSGRWKQTETAGGHEVTGVVTALGEGVNAVSVGDRVCVECFSHCGRCDFCLSGMYNHCRLRSAASGGGHAGFAEYVVAHESSLVGVPDTLTDEQAAMVEPVAVAYRAVARSGATHRDRLAVVGCGSIGILVIGVARAVGVNEIVALAKYDHQALAAREFGASESSQSSDNVGGAADVVIETTGSSGGFDDALQLVRPGGTIVMLGGYHSEICANVGRIVATEAVVTGSNCYGRTGMRTDFEWAIELIRTGRIQADKIVTHRFELTDVGKAFATAAAKSTGAIKVHVTMTSKRRGGE